MGAELTIFARFHARAGVEADAARALAAQIELVRREPGCLFIDVYRSTRDPRLFFLHSRWRDTAAFDVHAGLPNTMRFVETMERLIDHPLDVTRTRPLSVDDRSSEEP